MPPSSSVASALEPLITALFRGPSPLRIDMWDGSSLGPDTATTIRLHSPTALRRLLWAPGELGLARAYVSGDIQLEGSIFDLLAVRDRFVDEDGVAAEAGFTIRMLPRLWRAARQLGVLGPPPPPPAV